ncbi:response regulator [Pseudomonas putida]|uniref:response regulator n=1 Tax=Pseudomonas putida TaxID=303 RepID=UPI000D3DB6DB|nr:response regulator [Pseudomonas putida]PTV62619.1 response regulator [Pseudomonas putida]
MKDFLPVEEIHRPNVLIVEDEPTLRELLTLLMEDWGAAVTAVSTADEAREQLRKPGWRLVLTDVQTPGSLTGVDIAWITNEEHPDAKIIVMSGYYEFEIKSLPDLAIFLPKPWQVTKLEELVTAHLGTPNRAYNLGNPPKQHMTTHKKTEPQTILTPAPLREIIKKHPC